MAIINGKRVASNWTYNPRINVTEFNADEINRDNIVNQLLLIKDKDITSHFIMNLFGTFNGKSLCNHYDTMVVPPKGFKFENYNGKEVSNSTPFTTTLGIWIFNVFVLRDIGLSKVFGGYVNYNIDKKYMKGKIVQKLIYALIEDKITVEQYKSFLLRTEFCMPFESVLSPTHTEKILACSKEINKLKKELFEKYKKELEKGDEAAAALAEKIEKQLLDFATDYLKDDPSLDPYLSGAGGNIPNNFKNMYIMKGAVRNTDPAAKKEFDILQSSYIDGISKDEYAVLARSLTGGPYSRAKKTEIGGYWEKLVEAAFNTVILDKPGSDCGSKDYIEFVLTDDLVSKFMYSFIIKPNGKLEELTSDNLNDYIGKKIKVRSTLFCKNEHTVCNCCAGNLFYRRNSKNIGLACAQIPTKLKLISMKSFHDSTVTTTEIDPMKAFGLK